MGNYVIGLGNYVIAHTGGEVADAVTQLVVAGELGAHRFINYLRLK